MGLYEGLYERMTVLAFRPAVEVIDITGRNLEIEEFERLDAAANLLIERIQKLEQDREGGDGAIVDKIRKEYDQKLREAERRLKAKRKALTRKMRDMEEGKAGFERRMDDVRREIKECEVRRRIGEYDEPLYDMLVTEKSSEIEFLGRKIEVLSRNIDFYRRALAKEKDAFPCAACGALNPIWDKSCHECGADLDGPPEIERRVMREPVPVAAPAAALLAVSRPVVEPEPLAMALERTLVRDLASIDAAAMDLPPMGPNASGQPYLVRIQGPNQGERFDLDQPENGIGKAPDNKVAIPDDRALSRRHAKIVFEGGRPILYDLGSTNGTAVNGRAIEVSPLENDDEIAMGSSIYRFGA